MWRADCGRNRAVGSGPRVLDAMLYLDTSALVKLYFNEEGSEAVHDLVRSQNSPLPILELQEMELLNTFRLKVFWKLISSSEANDQAEIFERRKASRQYYFPEIERGRLMMDFRGLLTFTETSGCRTLDVMHVAFALQLKADGFVSFDERQRKLATETGLTVLPENLKK